VERSARRSKFPRLIGVFVVSTSSPQQTADLAGVLAERAVAGDVLILVGDLGAGKTAFSKAYGKALGVDEPITSPTFALAREYKGRLPLHHLDVYRLEHMSEVLGLDLPDLLDSGGVVLIEWGDAIVQMLPPDYLSLRFTFGAADNDRSIEFAPVGERWCAREPELAAALDVALSGGREPTC